jgi:hypothetical protein
MGMVDHPDECVGTGLASARLIVVSLVWQAVARKPRCVSELPNGKGAGPMKSIRSAGIGLVAALSLIGTMSGTASAGIAKSAQVAPGLQIHSAVTKQKLQQEIDDKLQELKIARAVLAGRNQLLADVDADFDAHRLAIKREIEQRVGERLAAEEQKPPDEAAIARLNVDIAGLEAHGEAVTTAWIEETNKIAEAIKEAEHAVERVEEELRALGVTPPP